MSNQYGKIEGLEVKIREAKIIHSSGGIKRCVCERAFDSYWLLLFEQKIPMKGLYDVLEGERGGERHFKTIEAAKRAAQEVGFAEMLTVWDSSR